ncbi:MAG: 4Fe-4S double cluster binding domain-containing protein [Promethearchaeota archaeon]
MTDRDILEIKIFSVLESKGYEGKIASAKHLTDLQYDIEKHHEQKFFDPVFYKDCFSYFDYEPELDLTEMKSILIVAVPQPSFKAVFHWHNDHISLLIPPTYLYGKQVIDEVEKILKDILDPEGYKVAYARIPFKTLAVRSGLAKFGKNNISYIPKLGSFYRLAGFYSDFPVKEDNWHELEMMELCENCSACMNNCPTGAIASDRFLLHGERCITYHNEQEGNIPFPDWLESSWHNCLVGCLHCQKVCPANKKVFNWIEQGPEFSEEETRMFLDGKKIEQLPDDTIKKLKNYNLEEYLEIFPRNLGVFTRS